MMRLVTRRLAPGFAAATLVLGGCAGDACTVGRCGPNSPWDAYTSDRASSSTVALYAPPFGIPADRAVTIRGSTDAGHRSFVWAVDGRPVLDAARRWDEPVVISADEPHRLSLGYDGGNIAATTQIDFTGGRGVSVTVKADDQRRTEGAQMWLEDAATRETVGDRFLVQLGTGPKPPPQPVTIYIVYVRHR